MLNKEVEEKTYEEYIEILQKQHEDLLERAKTEPISWVEIMSPIQKIYNLAMNRYQSYLKDKEK